MNSFSDTKQQAVEPVTSHDKGDELGLRDLTRKLYRRKAVIFGVFILAIAMTLLYLSRQVPVYTATAQLMFNTRQNQVVDVGAVLSGLPDNPWGMEMVIASEMEIIRSDPFLGRVADQLNLARDPLFNPDLRAKPEKGILAELRDRITGLWSEKSDAETDNEPVDPEEQAARVRKLITGMLADGLELQPVKKSYNLKMSYTSADSNASAKVVNAIADAYLTDQLEAKFEATRRANEWLSERLTALRQEVHGAELAVQKVKEQSNLVRSEGTTLLEQQIAELNAQLIIARVNRSQAEVRLQWARENIGRVNAIESMTDNIATAKIQQMRTEEIQLRRKEAEMSSRYGSRHPEMIKITAELTDLQEKIHEETQRLVDTLANEVEISKAKERALKGSLEEMRSQTSSSLKAEVELAELERQAEVSRTLYENFLSRFRETSAQADLQRPDARVISYADPPEVPSHPNKPRTMVIGGVLGLMLGLIFAFLLEALDRGFRQAEQVEQMTGLSVLGMIPLLSKNRTQPVDYVLEKPMSQFAEAIRGVRAAIQLSNVDHPPKTILVASSLPEEGKSTFCATLGRVAAMSGSKMLLIDGDLRRPSAAKLLGLKPEAWLEELLAGEKDLKSVVQVDAKSGLHVICGKGSAPNAQDLLGSKRMNRLVRDVSEKYDMVIIDTPPLMGVSDAWSLAQSVDELIFIVRWADTPRESVHAAMRQMEILNLPVGGIVLSQVDIRKQAGYGYGNYGYYYGKYSKYYKD